MNQRQVNIGDVELEAVVAGTGPVTVVFENGLGTSLEVWDHVAAPVVERTRVLRYRRRPAPPSGPVPVRTASAMAEDLAKLLGAARVAPPYVIVGHSWGGVIARVFAHRHPSEVAGLVMVDATHESIDSAGFALLPAMYSLMGFASRAKFVRERLIAMFCPPGSPAAYRARIEHTLGDRELWARVLRTVRAEATGVRSSLAALRRECPELPPVPVRVLTAGTARSVQRVHEAWKATVSRAPNARYTHVPESGHYMPIEAHTVVVTAILEMLESIATGSRRCLNLKS